MNTEELKLRKIIYKRALKKIKKTKFWKKKDLLGVFEEFEKYKVKIN
jgi:hypothetical protein